MSDPGPALLKPGDRVERYEVLGPLGEGATARVYRVRHTMLGTEHALKVMAPLPPSSEQASTSSRIRSL